MLVLNAIILGIFFSYLAAIFVIPDAWKVFERSFDETIGIMICFLLAACIQNYLQEYRFRRVFVLRKNIKTNFQRVFVLQEETEQLLLNVLPVHVAKRY